MRRENRLTGLMVAGLAAPLLLFAAFAAISHDAAMQDAAAMTRDRVAVLREHVTQILRFEEKVLRLADSLLAARDAAPDHAFLRDLARGQQTSLPLAAVAADGRITAVSGGPLDAPVSIADRAYFRQAMEGDGSLVIGRPTTTRVSEMEVIPIALRRSHGDGAFVIGLQVDYLRRVFADAAGEAGAAVSIALIRQDGVFLARHPSQESGLRLPPDAPLLRQAARASQGTFEARRVTDGAGLIASYARLGDYPVYVALGVERAYALEPWWRDVMVGGPLAAVTGLLLAGLAHSARRQARLARRASERLAAEVAQRTQEAERRAREAENASLDARRALAAVERADRAKVHFLAAVSHDLRQPLQALRLYLDFSDSRGPEVAVRALGGQARQAMEQMERLLRSTLDLSMIDTGALDAEVREVPLAPLLAELRRDFAPEAAKKGIDLVILPSSAVVRSDPVLLRRILTNLLSNAIRYTLQGRVLVGVRRGDGPRVVVADTGVGLSTEAEARIRDGRADDEADPPGAGPQGQGLGVGLSIVRRMVALLGHDMAVLSRPGRGSCFSVHLGEPRPGRTSAAGVASPGQGVTLETRRFAADAPPPR